MSVWYCLRMAERRSFALVNYFKKVSQVEKDKGIPGKYGRLV